MSKLSNSEGPKKSKHEFWFRHIKSQSISGLSQVQYCRDHQLKIATFHYWKAKLENQNISRSLLPVSIQPDVKPPSSSFSSGISIAVNNQLRIELEVGFNRDTLLKTLDLLQAR